VSTSRRRKPELIFSETKGHLELLSPMPWGRRVLFAMIGLFPLIAPWELLVRPQWNSYLNVFFFFAAVVAAGAVAVSLFFFFAAFAGLRSRLILDLRASTFTYTAAAPLVPRITRNYPLAAVEAVEMRTHVWSDGPDSYSLSIVTSDGKSHESSSSSSREEIEGYLLRATAFLDRARAAPDRRN
jgi:hypothetical protein